jgi:hypothetical protein
MRCPLFLCHCVRNTCEHLEMRRTRQSREAHRTRKENCLRKEHAKFKDGQGKYRAMISKMNAEARRESYALAAAA